MSKARRTYDHQWALLAARHLRAHPICVRIGCGQPATLVDHIVPVRVAPWRRLDRTNLQSLCHPCHNRITRAYDLGSLKGACNVDGEPLDPAHPWAQPNNAKAIEAANATRPADPGLAADLKRAAIAGRNPRPRGRRA